MAIEAQALQRTPDSPPGWLGPALAILSALFVALGTWPELSTPCPDLNDSAYHLALAEGAANQLSHGGSPIDFWLPDLVLGTPIFRHYQHLPHLVLALLHAPVAHWVSLDVCYRTMLGALLALFPLSIYVALRRFGLPSLTSGCAALIAPLLAASNLYGLSFESYLWAGSGLFAQLFASVVAPLALAESYRAVQSGHRLWLAALLIAATFLSQLVYGYMVALSTFAFLVPHEARRAHAGRLAVLLAVGFVAGAYFFVPALQSADFANHSVWEEQHKWDSLGAATVLSTLFSGKLLDNGRLPVLSLLAALGLIHALWRGDTRLRLIAGLFVGWVVLYFGRVTWGILIDLLPQARDIPLHRFVGAVHLLAIVLAGSGLALLLRAFGPFRRRRRVIAAILAGGLVLAPAVYERIGYLRFSYKLKRQARGVYDADPEIRPLLAQLKQLNAGRAYVGLPSRASEYLKVGSIPVTALCLVDGIDTLGFLWIPITFVGDVQVRFNPDDEAHCRTFGVRYLVFDADRAPPPFAHPVGGAGRFHIYEVASATWFGVADVPYVIPCAKRDVYEVGNAWLGSGLAARDVQPALDVGGCGTRGLPVVQPDRDQPGLSLVAAARNRPHVSGRLNVADRWSCRADLDQPAAVVLRAAFHPGLRATVDGQTVGVFPVTPGLAAVDVPAGSHAVHFWYQPATRWPWYVIALVALLLATPGARLAESVLGRLKWSPPKLTPHQKQVLAVLGLALLAGRPLLQNKELAGHDAVQYLTQLAEFDHCVRDGQIPPHWAPDLATGRGCPFFDFYPPLLLYVAEVLHLLGLGLIASMNLTTLGLLATAGLLMYFFARDRWGDGAGVVAAAAFLFSPYVMMDLYVRHAFLEASSFAWLPLTAWGVARGGIIRTALGFALLLISHPALAPFFVAGLLVYALGVRTLLRSVAGLAIGVGLAAWFVIPAVMERGYLKVEDVIHAGYLNYANHFAYLYQLAWSPWGFGLSVAGPGDGMSFRIGIPHVLVLLLAVWRLRTREARALLIMTALAAFLAITTSKPVWDAVPLLHPIQFPWRALAIVAFSSAALAGALLGRWPKLAVAAFVAFGLPLVGPSGYRDNVDNRDFTPERIARLNMQPGTLGIFEPRYAPVRPWNPQRVVVEGRARVVNTHFDTCHASVALDAATDVRLTLALNDFPGWHAQIDGHDTPIEAHNGVVTLPVRPGYHTIELAFDRTPLRKWMFLLSGLVALAVVLAQFIATRRRGRSPRQ